MTSGKCLCLCWVVLAWAGGSALGQVAPPFFSSGGVGLYNPQIGVVPSGVMMSVRPTVSADRKYVTIGIQPRMSQLVQLQTFPVMRGAGWVGGVVPAAGAKSSLVNMNASAPVRLREGSERGVFGETGMIRVAGLE